jgi:hypothetical protein
MKDYWNDPPEYPEAPECCDDEMEISEDGRCSCPHCGKVIEPQTEYDPGPKPIVELPEDYYFTGPDECLHGNHGDCDACDYLSDIAFDAARENRFFR